jgi:hypothetical protein
MAGNSQKTNVQANCSGLLSRMDQRDIRWVNDMPVRNPQFKSGDVSGFLVDGFYLKVNVHTHK